MNSPDALVDALILLAVIAIVGRRHRAAVRDGRTRRRLSRRHAPSDHGDRRQGRWAVYVPLRVNGKIVVPDNRAH